MTKEIANNHNEVKQILANVDVAVLRENVWKFMDSERDKISWDKTKGISCSFFAYFARKDDIHSIGEMNSLLEKLMDYQLRDYAYKFCHEHWDIIDRMAQSFGFKELEALVICDIINPNDVVFAMHQTPKHITFLAQRILGIQAEDAVLDICSGVGDFLTYIYLNGDAKSFTGIEVNEDAIIIAKMRNYFFNDVLDLQQGNVLLDGAVNVKADKVFVNAPFGLDVPDYVSYDPRFMGIIGDIPKMRNADWLFILSALNAQNAEGKTVVIVPLGTLFKMGKLSKVRDKILETKKLKSVIELPGGLFRNTAIAVAVLVFSSDNNTVRMVNAMDLGCKNGRQNVLSENDIKTIMERLEMDVEGHSISVTHDMIKAQESSWLPSRYTLADEMKVENGVTLGKTMKHLRIGNMLRPSELSAMTSTEPTLYQYLRVKDINDGTIECGSYISNIKGEDKVAIIHEDELLITRNSPFKVAVVPALTTTIIANHNTYMIELDKKKLHPVYVMLYLQSNQGKKQLEYRATGDRISILSRIAINDIEIPMIPMDEQLKIVEQYQALKTELVELQKQEKALRSRIESIMEGEN